MAKVLYIRDVRGGEVVEDVARAAAAVRRLRPGGRVSDADIARQLIREALRTPRIVRQLGLNGRGARDS